VNLYTNKFFFGHTAKEEEITLPKAYHKNVMLPLIKLQRKLSLKE